MKRSSITPATFMATPCTPVGRPNRKSERMIVQSGRMPAPRGNETTQSPFLSMNRATRLVPPVAITVPIAAPAVPNAGIGPRPRIRITFRMMFSTVTTSPMRSGVLASPAERSAPPSMKNVIIPKLNTNMVRR